MADFWHKFNELKFGNQCRRCGGHLPAGKTTAWGTKDANGRWLFLCPKCYGVEQKTIATPAEPMPEVDDADMPWMDNINAAIQAAHEPEGQKETKGTKSEKPYRPLLERLKDEAPWRFSKEVV